MQKTFEATAGKTMDVTTVEEAIKILQKYPKDMPLVVDLTDEHYSAELFERELVCAVNNNHVDFYSKENVDANKVAFEDEIMSEPFKALVVGPRAC